MANKKYTEQDLIDDLKKVADAGKSKERAFIAFSLKYGKVIKEQELDKKKLTLGFGMTESYQAEMRRMVNLAEDLASGVYGFTFADLSEVNTSEETHHDDYPEAKPNDAIKDYLKAIKTKPFLILGGFSGTGKSLSVKELAYMTCADVNGLQQDKMMPGNYCLVAVKPNWHDSTDLLGYYSSINNKYVHTKMANKLNLLNLNVGHT